MYPSDHFTASVMKDYNQITGTIPTEVGSVTNLEILEIGEFDIWIETFEAE